MSKDLLKKFSFVGLLFALLAVIAMSAAPVLAGENTFNLYVKHNINGRSLGLDKSLPVDVYVNGGYAFTFEFKDSFSAELPADTYLIEVKLAGTDTTVMSLGPVDIPASVDVTIKAQLSADKTPVLKAKIK